jgi:pimeloyl-ACP methyl ester carboxylesterase
MGDYARKLCEAAAVAGADRFAIVGFGFGGMVALRAALDRPDRVSRLVLVSASAMPGKAGDWNERAATVRAHGLAALAPAIVERWATTERRSAEPQLVASLRAALLTCSDDGYAAACEAIASFDVADRLPELELPTLVLAGAEDAGVPPEHGRRLAAAAPGARYEELGGAGHLPFLERPEAVRSLIADHLVPAVVLKTT